MKEKLLIEKILVSNGINRNAHRSLAGSKKNLVPEILEATAFLGTQCEMKERLFCIHQGIKLRPICVVCGNDVKFETRCCRYLLTCSSRCDATHRSKIKQGSCLAQSRIQNARLKLHDKDENGVSGYEKSAHKAKLTKRHNTLGVMSNADYEKFTAYRRQVYWHSKQWDLTQLENFHLRGRCGTPNAHQLDHRYSIATGFKNQIHPSIIGHIVNLMMVPWGENRAKGTGCSLTLQDLLLRIEAHES